MGGTRLRILAAAALATALAGAAAAEQPFRGLDAAEEATLAAGKAVIRSVRDARSLGLAASGKAAEELRARIASIRPNYVSEVIAIVQAPSAEAAAADLGRLAAALADVKGYVGIPYFSKRQQKTYDLFDKLAVGSRRPLAGGESIEATQHMEPFDDYAARYEYRLEGSAKAETALVFSGVNLDPIIYSYRNFKAVSPGDMVWALYAWREGDRVYFYGAGAVRAFDLFGAFRDRLEPSFTGRIQAFFDYMTARTRG